LVWLGVVQRDAATTVPWQLLDHYIIVQDLFNFVKYTSSRLLVIWLKAGKPRRRKKLCIFKPDAIGDFVLSSEALRQLIAQHGPDEVVLLVSHQVLSLAAKIFPGVEILPIVPGYARWTDKLCGLWGLKSSVQASAYGEVICLRHYRSMYEETILRAIHAERVVLLSNQSSAGASSKMRAHPLHFHLVQPEARPAYTATGDVPREWAYHAATMSTALGRRVAPESLRPNWDIHQPRGEAVAPFLLFAPLAGRCIRDLPLNLVEAAARKAVTSGLCNFLLTGSRDQAGRLDVYAEKLRTHLPSSRVDVVFPPNLPALVDLIASAAVVLTAESSTAHIAAALDRPALSLIGGGHFGWFAPWGRSAKQVWLTNRLPCFDCNWRCPYPEPLCITQIPTAEVEAALPAAGQT
jgi:ADP-heptose:LPS heptosyltransferase